MNNNSYLQELIDEYIRQKMQDDQTGYNRSLGDFANKMNNYGSKISKAGNIVSKKFANAGDKLSSFGSGMQNIGNTITDVQNIPTNFANNLAGQGLQKVGNTLINKGVNNAITNGLVNYGSQMAGSTAGTIGGNLASSLTGSSAGTTAGATLGANTVAGATGAGVAGSAGAGVGGATAGTAGATAGAGASAGAGATSAGALAGPVGAIVGAIIGTAVMGANRHRAKDLAKGQLAQTDQMAKAMVGEQEAQAEQAIANTNNLIAQQQNTQDGIVTGGASPLDNQSDPYQTLKEYQDYLTNNGFDKSVVNGVAQGLNSGNKEIDDWLKQYSQSAEAKANGFKIPTSDVDIANAKKLAQGGGADFTAGTTKNFDQSKLINKLAKGFADFQTGYQDNRNNAFKPENLIQYENEKKSIMQKLGEGAGTTARLAQNPAIQGIVAGGLSTALTGNPLYGLGMANKFTSGKHTSDMYKEQLANQGVNVNVGALGRLDSKDFNALMTPSYRDAQIEMAKAKLAETEAYHKAWEKMQQDKLAQEKELKTKDLEIKQQNATSNRIKANKTGSRNAQTKKPQNSPSWNNDLAEYTKRIVDPRYATQVGKMKATFIGKYGVDPDKYIKL